MFRIGNLILKQLLCLFTKENDNKEHKKGMFRKIQTESNTIFLFSFLLFLSKEWAAVFFTVHFWHIYVLNTLNSFKSASPISTPKWNCSGQVKTFAAPATGSTKQNGIK